MIRLAADRCRRCIALFATVVLAGCASGLLPKPAEPLKQYALNHRGTSAAAVAMTRVGPEPRGTTLIVGETRAAPGFDTKQIVYVRDPDRIESFALSRWVDTPARMLAPLLVAALDRSDAFGAVLGAPTAANGTWRLDTELIRLQQDFTHAPSRVRLTLRAVVIETATRRVLASRTFDATVLSPSDDTAGGVAAANLAVDEVLAGVTSFCADAVRRSP